MLDLISNGHWPPAVVVIALGVMVAHAAAAIYGVWCWREDVLYKRARKAERRRRASVKAAEKIHRAQANVRPVRKSINLQSSELIRSKASLN